MEGTKTSLRAMQLKLKREAELKERIAAFAVFSKNAEKAKKLSRNLQARPRTDSGAWAKCWRNRLCNASSTGHICLPRHLREGALPCTGSIGFFSYLDGNTGPIGFYEGKPLPVYRYILARLEEQNGIL